MKPETRCRGMVEVSLLCAALVACAPDEPGPTPPASTGTLAARIARANQNADRDLKLLVRLELSPDELFEVYEPAPGQIVISQAGAPSEPVLTAQDLSSLSVEELWGRVAGSRTMPETLTAALQRMALRDTQPRTVKTITDLAAGAGGGTDRVPTTVDPIGAGEAQEPTLQVGFCDWEYYSWGYGDCDQLRGSWNICKDNWLNGAWAFHPDIEHLVVNVCAATGSGMNLKITSDEWNGGVFNVPVNTVRQYRAFQHGCDEGWNDCPNARADVVDAIGERFHFRFLVSEPSPCDSCP